LLESASISTVLRMCKRHQGRWSQQPVRLLRPSKTSNSAQPSSGAVEPVTDTARQSPPPLVSRPARVRHVRARPSARQSQTENTSRAPQFRRTVTCYRSRSPARNPGHDRRPSDSGVEWDYGIMGCATWADTGCHLSALRGQGLRDYRAGRSHEFAGYRVDTHLQRATSRGPSAWSTRCHP